jgi:hypothetical protein
MKWLLVVLGCVVLLVALVAVVGLLLPKGHVASRKLRLKQTPEAVFQAITDFPAMPTWRLEVSRIEILSPRDGKPSFRETTRQGSLTYVVEEVSSPSRLVTRIVDNSAFGGTWTFDLTPEQGACQITITERGEVYNPIFRTLGKLFFSPAATMESYLRALASKFGEAAVPEA